jgi:hypothetical protein
MLQPVRRPTPFGFPAYWTISTWMRFGDFLGLLLAIESDAVHEDVEAAEVVGDVINHHLRLRDRRGVESGGMRTDCIGADSGFRGVVSRYGHFRPRGEQAPRYGLPNAAIATRDQRDLPVEPEDLVQEL